MDESSGMPLGWAWSRLGELGTWSGGGTPSKANKAFWSGGSIPWISPKDMKCERIKTAEDSITEEAVEKSSAKMIPEGSVLMVTRSGILAHTFPVAVNECAVAVNQDLKTLTPHGGVASDYLVWFLRANNYSILKACAKHGTTVASIDTDRLKNLPVPIAPLSEQRRIVDKIESLFAQLDHGEASLRDVQKLLARYRQSVLKAAVTGQLTADWRAENADRLESGSDLLERILKARRENWQGRGKYKEPVAPDTRDLPELPEGWVWASVGQLVSKIEAGKNFRCIERPPEGEETGIVKISAVTWEDFRELESKTITSQDQVLESCLIQPGDLLISRANTVELVGATSVVERVSRRLQLSDKVLRLRCIFPVEYWLNYVLRSRLGRDQIESYATGAQMSMRNISQRNLERIAVPLPSLEELSYAVDLIRQMRARSDVLSSHCLSELARSAALRQSILKDAFAGKLVSQDPEDEPASELLVRNCAERDAAAPKKRTRKKATA